MTCYKCGAELPEDSRFCPKCGHELRGVSTSITVTADKKATAGVSKEPLPYRWGRFQGWFMIVVGAFLCLITVCIFLPPENPIVRGFVRGYLEASGKSSLFQRWQAAKGQEDYGYFAGYLGVQLLLVFGAGIGLLKKRTFGVLCVLFLIFRALTTASIPALAFWLGSMPYYYKRRHEFLTP